MLLPLLVGLFLQQPLGPPLEVVPATPEPPEVPASIHWWSPADGLPQAQVNALASDPLGRIWMGTHAGLAIFDGTEIRPLTDAASLASQRVRSLCLDDRQRMWIGTERRGLAIFDRYDDPRSLRWIPVAEELGSNFQDLTHIRQARDGSL
ncbi:MAG: two-component regulator propeller domain-containing protein, partial [Planctomycetota bacterium]